MDDRFIKKLANQVSRSYRKGANVRDTARAVAELHFPKGSEECARAVSDICRILGKRGNLQKRRRARPPLTKDERNARRRKRSQLQRDLVVIRRSFILEEMEQIALERGDHLLPEDQR